MGVKEIILFLVLAAGHNYTMPPDIHPERGDYIEIVKVSEKGDAVIAEHRFRDLRLMPPNEEE